MRQPFRLLATGSQTWDDTHQQLTSPLVLVWDNLNTHVSATMTELIAARDWLTVYRLPPYAHELNPLEQVWSHLKRSLANLAKRNLAQLTALVKTRLKRMQYRPALIEGFLACTRLDFSPLCKPTMKHGVSELLGYDVR
jgi:transposase